MTLTGRDEFSCLQSQGLHVGYRMHCANISLTQWGTEAKRKTTVKPCYLCLNSLYFSITPMTSLVSERILQQQNSVFSAIHDFNWLNIYHKHWLDIHLKCNLFPPLIKWAKSIDVQFTFRLIEQLPVFSCCLFRLACAQCGRSLGKYQRGLVESLCLFTV